MKQCQLLLKLMLLTLTCTMATRQFTCSYKNLSFTLLSDIAQTWILKKLVVIIGYRRLLSMHSISPCCSESSTLETDVHVWQYACSLSDTRI